MAVVLAVVLAVVDILPLVVVIAGEAAAVVLVFSQASFVSLSLLNG